MTLSRLSAVAAAALISLATTSADAPGTTRGLPGPKIVERTEYYDIGGASIPALWQSMSLKGPRSNEAAWAGHARWEVRWTFDWRADAGGCRIETVTTDLDVVYTLPRWAGRDRADHDLRERWDRFVLALRVHEEGHGANGRRAAHRIEDALRRLGSRADCPGLAKAADETARRIIEEEAANDRAYDAATLHGARQGVVLR